MILQIIDEQIRWYDLTAVMNDFNWQQQQFPADFANWNLNTALENNLLGTNTDLAYGGDLAYRYANGGNNAMPSVESIRQILEDSTFGIEPQPVSPTPIIVDINMTGTAGDDILSGGAGNDTIDGFAGNDILTGGAGTDVLTGGSGDDTYIYNPDDGIDTINDTALPDEGNTLVFGEGITPDAISLDLGSLLIRTGTDGDAIHINNFNPDDVYGEHAIETFQFADGTTLSYNQLLERGFDLTGTSEDDLISGTNTIDRISGLDGNDTITGGRGDDILLGGIGNDRYIFQPGDGNDRIVDNLGNNSLVFGDGLTASDLEAVRQGDDLVLHIQGAQDSITLADWFQQSDMDGVNNATFDDGTLLTRAGIELLMNRPPAANPDKIILYEDAGPLLLPTSYLLVNDTDPDPGDVLSVTAVGTSAVGAAISLTNDAITYDIDGGFQSLAEGEVLHDSFAYTVQDLKGASADGIVQVDIVGVNDTPITTADIAHVVEDETIIAQGNLLANDYDIDTSDVLHMASPGDYTGKYGTLSLTSDGTYSYTLDNESSTVQSLGRDHDMAEHFELTVTDSIAEVTSPLDVYLHGTNDAPILTTPLADQQFTCNKSFSWQMPEESFTDIDLGDTLTYTAALADGSELPDWLSFDPTTRTFSGRTPKHAADVAVRVTATDQVAATGSTDGSLSTSVVFVVEVNHGNQGVGNGQDATPAGHTVNFNDGPGTAPGSPGAKTNENIKDLADKSLQQTNSLDTGTQETLADATISRPQDIARQTKKNGAYLNAGHWDEQSPLDEASRIPVNRTATFANWLAMDLAIAEALADRPTFSRLDHRMGADTAGLGKTNEGFLGSTTMHGKDVISLLAGSGQTIRTFHGLAEGLQKIA